MKKKKTIFIFGNPLLEFDSKPIKMLSGLKKEFPEIEFKVIDPNENLKPVNKEMIIIDTVEGIDKVQVIDDINLIVDGPKYTPHDLDLGFNIKLLHKLGKLDKILIFGIPMEGDVEPIFGELVKEIQKNKIK